MPEPPTATRETSGRPPVRAPRAVALLVLAFTAGTAAGTGPESAAPKGGLSLLEAVAMTLEHDPHVALVESRVEASRGALLVASSRFDPELSASVSQDESQGTEADTSTLTSAFGLTGELRSGLRWESAVEVDRTDAAGAPVNVATVSFTLRQPLLRDRGREVVTAEERAAERELEASRLDREHRVAERLRAVVTAYWGVRAAMADLDVLRATETRSRELLETTRRLIEADVTPAAEIVQLEADLVSREANRIAGEQTLFRARQDLGREIGLPHAEIARLPLPDAPFPTVVPEEIPPPEAAPGFVERSLERRADLRAAAARLAAAESRRRAADNATRPGLDLVFTPSYSGRADGSDAADFFSPLFDVPGWSASLTLGYSWPIRNRRAEGLRIQAVASVEQSALSRDLTARSIGAEVGTALDAVRRGAAQLAKIDEAEGYFEKALENELKKLRAGSSTLIDVISQRDRLTAVRRQQVSARLALARALLELRFETGTLLSAESTEGSIRGENLVTLPF